MDVKKGCFSIGIHYKVQGGKIKWMLKKKVALSVLFITRYRMVK